MQLHSEKINRIHNIKNGYGDMVIMSMETYEKANFFNNLYEKLALAEAKRDYEKLV